MQHVQQCGSTPRPLSEQRLGTAFLLFVNNAEGSHEVFLSPGLQIITKRWIFETSLQLPIVQEFDGGAPEAEYRLVMGFRFQW